MTDHDRMFHRATLNSTARYLADQVATDPNRPLGYRETAADRAQAARWLLEATDTGDSRPATPHDHHDTVLDAWAGDLTRYLGMATVASDPKRSRPIDHLLDAIRWGRAEVRDRLAKAAA